MKNSMFVKTAMLSLLLLTGCTINVEQKQFIRPDKPITQQWLTSQQQGQTLHAYQVTATDGVVLHGKLIRHPDARFTLIYFGGNLFNSDSGSFEIVKALGQFQNNVLMLDHRGSNGNGGSPEVANLASDGIALFDAVMADASLKHKPVLLHGFSLGSMIAAHVAGQRPAAALVMEGSITTVAELAEAQLPLLMKPFVSFEIEAALKQVDNTAILARIQTPLLVCVGAKDPQTPAELSETLFAAASSPIKQLYIAEDMGHVNLFSQAEAVAQYKNFLAKAFAKTL